MPEKLVDGDFIARLAKGSYEVVLGAVDEAVQANAKLFSETGSSVTTIATFSSHLIVASEEGEFYRAKWQVNEEDGSIVLSEVEQIDVPVYEAESAAVRVREEADRVVGLAMAGDVEAAGEGVTSLYRLVKAGVRLTAEGVEDLYNGQDFAEDDWFKATVEQEKTMREFLGAEALRLDVPKPRFEALVDGDSEDAEARRDVVKAALAKLRDRFQSIRHQLALARQVNETYTSRDGNAESVVDFVEFVQGLDEALNTVNAILADAAVVAEDGCVKCLARVHDGLASQAYEWVLAASFAEKLARRFEMAA